MPPTNSKVPYRRLLRAALRRWASYIDCVNASVTGGCHGRGVDTALARCATAGGTRGAGGGLAAGRRNTSFRSMGSLTWNRAAAWAPVARNQAAAEATSPNRATIHAYSAAASNE